MHITLAIFYKRRKNKKNSLDKNAKIHFSKLE